MRSDDSDGHGGGADVAVKGLQWLGRRPDILDLLTQIAVVLGVVCVTVAALAVGPKVQGAWRHHQVEMLAARVGSAYGDPHPVVVRFVPDHEEVTHQLMYGVWIDGNFRQGDLTANRIYFSALASGKEIWAVGAFTNGIVPVWSAASFPPP